MDKASVDSGLTAIDYLADRCNKKIEVLAPWTLAKDPKKKETLDAVLYHLAESLRIIAILISPVLPKAAKFLDQLNPGKTKAIRAGDRLKVPNVEPFEVGAVKDLKPGSEIAASVANDLPDEPETARGGDAQEAVGEPAPGTVVNVDTKTNFLTVLEGNKLVAAFPVTIGSAQTVSPVGEWKVRGVAKLPTFRYDEQMLSHGERSKNFHMLPSGPNNPVGVVWIALNKKGIGLHGTEDPDSIGRSASHGCVRLANWDIVRLAAWIKSGVPVSIY